jgi:ABC-type multidrug transport system fused ATPase/permease subunit
LLSHSVITSTTLLTTIGETLARQLQAGFTLVIGLAVGLSASWRIGLVVLATLPVNLLATVIQLAAFNQKYVQ